MEIEETTKSEDSFATDLAKQTTAVVVITAASVAAMYGTMAVLGLAVTGAQKLKARFSKKNIDAPETTESE